MVEVDGQNPHRPARTDAVMEDVVGPANLHSRGACSVGSPPPFSSSQSFSSSEGPHRVTPSFPLPLHGRLHMDSCLRVSSRPDPDCPAVPLSLGWSRCGHPHRSQRAFPGPGCARIALWPGGQRD